MTIFCAAAFVLGCGSGTLSLYDEDGNLDTSKILNSASPTSEATGITVTSTIVLIFDRELTTASVTTTSVTLTKASDSSSIAGSVTLSSNGTQITFDPTSSLEYSTRYCINLTGLESADGDTLSTYTLCFTTEAEAESTSSESSETLVTGIAVNASKLKCDASDCCWFADMNSATAGTLGCYNFSSASSATITNLNRPQQLLLNDNKVCYILDYNSESNKRIRCADRGTPVDTATWSITVDSAAENFVNGQMADNTYFYYGDGTNAIKRASLVDGSVSTICSGVEWTPIQTVIDGSRIFFNYAVTAGNDFTRLGTCPITGSAGVTFLGSTDEEAIAGMESDGTYLYFLDGVTGSAPSSFVLKRVPVDASAAIETLASGLTTHGTSLAVSSNYVYISVETGIVRVPKAGGAVQTVDEGFEGQAVDIVSDTLYFIAEDSDGSSELRSLPLGE